MKSDTATFHDTDLVGRASASSGGLRALLARAFQSWRRAAKRRQLRDELSGMSDSMLLDIGVADDEIYRVRRGDNFIPRAWTRASGAGHRTA